MTHPLLTVNNRRNHIIQLAARKALELPVLPSGFWFHSDVRDNYYYAIHLYAYCIDTHASSELTQEQRRDGLQLAVEMIRKVIRLQVQDSGHPMYGHWPLNLGTNPDNAPPNGLPVELMGCLLLLFYHQYQNTLPIELKSELNLCFVHIYHSRVYRHPLEQIHHHEAKHTALKLLLGHQFDDQELLEQGIRCAMLQLHHIRKFGFKEYGALPWHWHWIQAFTCVWEMVDHPEARVVTGDMLETLWQLRAQYYLRGTWVGAQSRQWPHDGPKDNNTLLDYIQFGDFPMPQQIARLEGAGLYTYEISEEIRRIGTDRTDAVEVKRLIRFAGADEVVKEEAHTHAYIAPDYAVGGIWERREEFDNEQQRWDVTLPLTNPSAKDGVNQAFFFHPGARYQPGDDRHASNTGEVLLHKDAVIQLWELSSADQETAYPALVGCLPKGDWHFTERSGYGQVGDVYLVFHSMNDFTVEEKRDRLSVLCPFQAGRNGIVIEAMTAKETEQPGDGSAAAFAAMRKAQRAGFAVEEAGTLTARYVTRRGDVLELNTAKKASVNGKPIAWEAYTISG